MFGGKMDRKPVDIIIPIYNAYNDLVLCMRSIRKYTDLTLDRVILINDCSTDTKITPFLETQEEEHVVVVQNEKNQGFSGNVNLGMQMSADRDVILLNSDTVVTKGWVDKIVACAYSAEEIGTVTPLSNSATLCSVPIMCQDNPVPDNVTIDEYAELIERCSFKKYPRITVAVGFCMFIKRKVIEEVGLFDAETFQRGYGEENDFCNRAGLLGYSHVMCDDTFVYHKGTVSFLSEEKQQLISEHDAVLQERYPMQMKRNHEYCMENPEQYIRDNINFYTKLKNGKKNILYLVQSDFRRDADNNVGGTQFHVRDLVQEVRKNYNVFVAARVGSKLRLSIYNEESLIETLEFEIGRVQGYQVFRDSRQYQIYINILKAFSIGLVHVHHTLGLTLDLFYAARDLGIPVHLTMHDFYYLCPNEKLLNSEQSFCDGSYENQKCKECLSKSKNIAKTVDYMKVWRREHERVLEIVEKIYTPSQSAKKIIEKVYPTYSSKIKVIYHGSEFAEKTEFLIEDIKENKTIQMHFDYLLNGEPGMVVGWAYMEGVSSTNVEIYLEVKDKNGNKTYISTTMIRRVDVAKAMRNMEYEYCGFSGKIIENMYPKGKLKIRLIVKYQNNYYTDGNVYEVKNEKGEEKRREEKRFNIAFVGGMVPEKGSQLAFQLIQGEKEKVSWFVFGAMNDRNLEELAQENLTKIGAYDKEDLPMLLRHYQIDLICILSIWPETFCYTLSEALLCDIPVLTVDDGAMGERIRLNQCGWLVSKKNPLNECREKINWILENPQEYQEKKERAKNHKEKTLQEMADEYAQEYEKAYCEGKKQSYDTELIWKARQTIQ